jgi:hypothetical protein
MAPYKASVFSDQDLADIYAFLRSIPVSSGAQTIPLLNR